MSINIPSSAVGLPALGGLARGLGSTTDVVRRPATPNTGTAGPVTRAESSQSAAAAGSSSVDTPSGVDPALWSALTREERSFFAQSKAMGPLTYGPGRGNGAGAGMRLGGRIDMRV